MIHSLDRGLFGRVFRSKREWSDIVVEQGRKAKPADPEAGNGTGEAGEAAEAEVEK